MSTRMVMSIAFVASVVLGMLVYILNDTSRAQGADQRVIERQSEAGAKLFGANCSQCHGPLGEGAIGPAVNRKTWRGDDKSNDNAATSEFLRKVLTRGQYSPQPGINMPAWSKDYGGSLNDEQIDDLVHFLMYGDWEEILHTTSTPNYIALPVANDVMKKKYPQADTNPQQKEALDKELTDMKSLLQNKGCVNCHVFGSLGSTLGPNLTEVGSRRTADWMYRWIENPTLVENKDRGPNLEPWFSSYATPRTDYWPMNPTWMPIITMTQQERQKIVDYLAGLKVPPAVLQQQQQQKANNTNPPLGQPTPTATPGR